MHAMQNDGMYPDYVLFYTREIENYIFLYVYQGISPLLRIETKFLTLESDVVNGYDLLRKN